MAKTGPKPRPLADRFWEKVDKTDGCWNWTAAAQRGYGAMRNGWGKPLSRAHRVSWELHFGSIPNGLIVCHRCDNRRCVRPDHLFLGTKLDNTTDMLSKGRGRWAKV